MTAPLSRISLLLAIVLFVAALFQKQIAEAVQVLTTQFTPEIPLGEYLVPIATRKTVKGILTAPVPVFWNVEVGK